MISIFSTDIKNTNTARSIVKDLVGICSGSKINFYFEEDDTLLRFEADQFDAKKIITIVGVHGHLCQELPIDL
ncbi:MULTISPECIES: hypothetical protein [Bacteroidota]|uniref:hypothetical protein n=1 Tax=Bacteroidota TaxID=976 RepID=UPI00241F8E96|nr:MULTISPECIES: hypothetical protein [Bacteroidota]